MKRLLAIGSFVLLLVIVTSCAKTPAPPPAGNTPLPIGNQTSTTQPPAASDKPGAGDAAPDLQLVDMTGKAVSLADYKGQIVWLNFWATW